ncbi:MAG: helix-turn-helix domain-containing protein [Minwuia sp.]|uniref:helix-turn-helix domain-containing protein n=1 Tax=Minwuia sp. TaxID=2493630 RepID=UPI003A898BA4
MDNELVASGFASVSSAEVADSFAMIEARPAPDIGDLVLRYQGFEAHRPTVFDDRQPAGLFFPLIVNFGPRWTIASGGVRPGDHDSFAAGLIDRFTDIRCDGAAACLQIDFTPFGARAFFGLPLNEIAEQVVALDDLMGQEGRDFIDRLGHLRDWRARLDLADRFVRGRLRQAPPAERRIAAAWRAIAASHGAARIADVAASLDCSREHLTRRFRDQIGHGPKTVARIFRHRNVCRLAGELDFDWAAIAHETGYADQAHLVREFSRMQGRTPTAWAASHSFNTERGGHGTLG